MVLRKSLCLFLIASLMFVSLMFVSLLFAAAAYGQAGQSGQTGQGQMGLTAPDKDMQQQLKTWRAMIVGGAGVQEIRSFYVEHLRSTILQSHTETDEKLNDLLIDRWMKNGDREGAVQALFRMLNEIEYKQMDLSLQEAADALARGDQKRALEWVEFAEAWTDTLALAMDELDERYGTFTRDNMQTVLFPALRTSIEKEQFEPFHIFAQMLDKLLLKLFLMDTTALWDEADRRLNEGHLQRAEQLLMIAETAYDPLGEWLHADLSRSHDPLRNLRSDAEQFDAQRAKRELAGMVNQYIQRNVKEVFVSATQEKNVLERVAEGIAAVAMLETIVEDVLGEGQFAIIQRHGELYFAAVQDGDLVRAEEHAFRMLKELSRVKGVYFTVGEDRMTANGRAMETGLRAAYIDPLTGRMMVSVRFVGEALQAEVEYDPASKKIAIARNGTEIEMVVGSRIVRIDGNESDYRLDQSVTLRADRAYIPLRVTAELLGHDVYWYRGEVAIN